MEKNYRVILFLLIFLIIMGGFFLFFQRDDVLKTLESEIKTQEPASVGGINVSPSREVLDTDILKSTVFVALKNNIIIFDFENICKKGVEKKIAVSIIGEDEEEAVVSPSKIKCVLGNNIPFLSKRN